MLDQSTFKKIVYFYLFRRKKYIFFWPLKYKIRCDEFSNFPGKPAKRIFKIFQTVVISYRVAVRI